MAIKNPVLRGFNPDPSILRVEDDYYIATSTFEWFPGVQIHHSRDLRNWRLLTRPLERISQLDMRGNPDSGGVWAPCLSYCYGIYYLIYSDMKSHLGPFKDSHNYLVTANDINGPWSRPIYLNSSGFDPSLYHADDGKKWLLNMVWDHRKGKNKFGGILMQEYSQSERRLVGPIYNIFQGTSLGLTEGPHLYWKNGYYYLITAEGGTRYGHAVTLARSESLFGPYTADPASPLLTAADKPELELQRTGHASLVETKSGEWYMAYLCGRPLRPEMRCTLGRETALQKVEWTEDGWLRLVGGGSYPQTETPAPNLTEHRFPAEVNLDQFDGPELNKHFQALRIPITDDWASLQARPGYLRLKGRESLYSKHNQSLIARRVQSFNIAAETAVEFFADNYQQMAGLICYYNTNIYFYLHVSRDEELGRYLNIMCSNRGIYEEPLDHPVRLDDLDRIWLKVTIERQELQFYYKLAETDSDWAKIGPVLDAGRLSDEYAENVVGGYLMDQGFTGAYVGICVQDLSGSGKCADFDYFSYSEQ